MKQSTLPRGTHYVPYETSLVQFVDHVIELNRKRGGPKSIGSEKDWDTVKFLYKGFKILFPEDAHELEKHMVESRKINKKGLAKEKNAMVQHVLEVPAPFYKMINAIYPEQKWDKKFVRSFAKHFPTLSGYEK